MANVGGLSFAINPQRPGAVAFTDTDAPQFVNTMVGNVAAALIPVKEFTSGEDGTNATPQILTLLADGSYLGQGQVDLVVTARDGGQRKGVYLVGVTVAPTENPFDFHYNGQSNVRMDSVLDGNAFAGIKTIYLRRNEDNPSTPKNEGSDTYFGTNVKENFSGFAQASEIILLDFDNAAVFPDGQYEACATIEDFPSAPFDHSAETCITFTIVRPPELTSITPSTSALSAFISTNTPLITWTLKGSFGPMLPEVLLEINGVAVIPDSVAFGSLIVTYTPPAPLPDGPNSVRIVVDDIAGNTFDHTEYFAIDTASSAITVTDFNGFEVASASSSLGTRSQRVTIEVVDALSLENSSGIKLLELYLGDPASGGVLFASSAETYLNAHVYDFAEIPALASLSTR